MNARTVATVSMAVLLSVACAEVVQARPWWGARRRHADRNKDGVVTPRERHWERRWETRPRAKVNSAWERKMDADHDGWVEPGEVNTWRLRVIDVDHNGMISVVEHRTYWVNWKGVVNTPLERQYDANHDGYLEWPEARALMQDRLRIIETDGRAVVDTEIEREFDADGDGVIDRDEAEAIREVLN
ncbi:MAG: hypothetical protein KKC51_10295 [Verrucomicrobia bacterium]|nr:hypothetical protein [Verrucomicrobiota bacterium]